jgi:hypothetical protein
MKEHIIHQIADLIDTCTMILNFLETEIPVDDNLLVKYESLVSELKREYPEIGAYVDEILCLIRRIIRKKGKKSLFLRMRLVHKSSQLEKTVKQRAGGGM